MLYQKEIPVRFDVDVFVAGGGPSGVAAAVSAAKLGKRVFLAENTGSFGGMGTNALVPIFMAFADGEHFLCGDVAMAVRDGISDRRDNSDRFYPIHPEVLKRVYDDIVTKSGVEFSFFTQLLDVECEDGTVNCAVLHGKSGFYAVKAKVFVDCTGDGDLAALAGAEYEKGDADGNLQPPTLCTLWKGISPDAENQSSVQVEKAFADGVFTQQDRHFSGLWITPTDPDLRIGNLGHIYGVDGTDERDLTRGMLIGRKQAAEYQRFYQEYVSDGYENMALCQTASVLGVRETRRICGDYQLNLQDFLNRASFPDEIGRYSYPVDIHASSPKLEDHEKFEEEFRKYRYKTGETYGIPYRALTVSGLKNVLVAGRCISADRSMQASVRVMPCCMLTGQAAGTAAALTCDAGDVRTVDYSTLKSTLQHHGVWIP